MSTRNTRRWFTSIAGLGGLGLLAANAHAHGGWGGGWGRHGGTPPSAQEMTERMREPIGRMVQDLGGTPEQRDRLVALAQTAMQDVKPLREQHMAARKKGLELLSAPTIDRAALERLRQEQMTAAQAMSQRMVQHMADAADVLTPAQRTKLAERWSQRGGRGGHGGHGGWWGMGG